METPESDLLITGGTNPVITDTPTGFTIRTDQYTQIFSGSFAYQESGKLTPESVIDSQLITEPDGTQRNLLGEMSLLAGDVLAYSDEDYKGKQELIFRGADTLTGSGFSDILFGYLSQDTIYGGQGDDNIHGMHGRDTLYGEDGNDTIRGGHGPDQIFGGNGGDWIWGGIGRNTIDAGAGDNARDDIYVPVDSINNTQYGNPGGANFDPLLNLGAEDKIYIHGEGITNESLTFGATSFGGYDGIGIYANGTLEALVTGGFSAEQVQGMTTGGFFA